MTIEEAKKLLYSADLFFYDEEDEEDEFDKPMLNMNDVWGWACADGEFVEEDEFAELARLFRRYGWCGVLYWVSKKRGGERSEFLDNNRFIDFVAQEEALIASVPESDKRAYYKYPYSLGE